MGTLRGTNLGKVASTPKLIKSKSKSLATSEAKQKIVIEMIDRVFRRPINDFLNHISEDI